MSLLWWSLGRAIFGGRKHDSPYFSLSCYFTYLDRVTLPEDVGTVATLEGAVPPYNFNANENENVEEVSGENCVSLFSSILLCNHVITVHALPYFSLMDIYQDIVTARGGEDYRNTRISTSCQL